MTLIVMPIYSKPDAELSPRMAATVAAAHAAALAVFKATNVDPWEAHISGITVFHREVGSKAWLMSKAWNDARRAMHKAAKAAFFDGFENAPGWTAKLYHVEMRAEPEARSA